MTIKFIVKLQGEYMYNQSEGQEGWTKDIKKAHRFESEDEALFMCETYYEGDPWEIITEQQA